LSRHPSPAVNEELQSAAAPRWRGQPGRLEVWYATLSDPATRAGLWVHYEMVSPTSTSARDPYAHGWVSWFPSDGPPHTERFGPEPVGPAIGSAWLTVADARIALEELTGRTGSLTWNLSWKDSGAPLWTFPRPAWERELLPGAQVVVAPTAQFTGSLRTGDTAHRVDGCRWGWIHADLGDGDVLEVVTAVSRKAGLHRLSPIAFIRFRFDGKDWPASVLPAVRMRTKLGLRHWQLNGRIGGRRVLIRVDQPAERCVSLGYTDPDGAGAVCTNSEQADIYVEVGDRRWSVVGTGHAEVGLRAAE
jgi:hypothetical protein